MSYVVVAYIHTMSLFLIWKGDCPQWWERGKSKRLSDPSESKDWLHNLQAKHENFKDNINLRYIPKKKDIVPSQIVNVSIPLQHDQLWKNSYCFKKNWERPHYLTHINCQNEIKIKNLNREKKLFNVISQRKIAKDTRQIANHLNKISFQA